MPSPYTTKYKKLPSLRRRGRPAVAGRGEVNSRRRQPSFRKIYVPQSAGASFFPAIQTGQAHDGRKNKRHENHNNGEALNETY
jgi:hypothetical protein